MKKLFPFIFMLVLISCAGSKQSQNRILPAQVKKEIYLSMTEGDFLQAKSSQVVLAKKEDFRTIYAEKFNGDPYVESIVYYISNGESPQLYEIMTIYKSEEAQKAAAWDMFGEPNHNETQWRITRKNDFNIWAWSKEKKLVIVAMIPGNEWSDQDWNN